ncbi:MAG: hypothetical protein N3B16_03500 [Candidatus Aminicenantes bacterium]|nr:hypothetical protein [Candidatus Aminicenantes bacterium]
MIKMLKLKALGGKIFLCVYFFLIFGAGEAFSTKERLIKFLPQLPSWFLSQEPEFYGPSNLFEYIDGASEAYLAYDFQGLIVGLYQREKDKDPVITVEIYDMGETIKAYGIYSSERPTEGNFVEIGLEGYLEEGALHFLASSFYIKIFSFLPPDEAEKLVLLFGQEIAKLIPQDLNWQPPEKLFPPTGLKPYSIKFILKNFLGFDYLHNALIAAYERDGLTFEAFIIQAQDKDEAAIMESRWKKELALTAEKIEEKNSLFYGVNKYFRHLYLARSESFIFGLIRLPQAKDELALTFIKEWQSILKDLAQKAH